MRAAWSAHATTRQGWLVRRQGLMGTFVADPVEQGSSCGVRTITQGVVQAVVLPPAGRRAVADGRRHNG